MIVSEKKLVRVFEQVLGIGADEDSKISVMKKRLESLKEEIADLKLKKTIEEKEIKHLVKMHDEKQVIEATKKELELKGNYQTKEMDLQKKYHNDIILMLKNESEKFQSIYEKILERLPNVNVEIKKR